MLSAFMFLENIVTKIGIYFWIVLNVVFITSQLLFLLYIVFRHQTKLQTCVKQVNLNLKQDKNNIFYAVI